MNKAIIASLERGEIGVIPTDTMYGLVGSALNKKTVERIYKVRKRDLKKPLIILIDSIERLKDFAITDLSDSRNPLYRILKKIWPDKITVILPCDSKKFEYLHRGRKKLAFRLPAKNELANIIKKTGPLVVPSANISGRPPSTTIKEAQKYFGRNVDFYVDGGEMKAVPSTIIEIDKKGSCTLIREGAVKASSKKLKALLQ